MNDVATLTLNPAIDISTSVPKIEPIHKLRCTEQLRDPGGGGINVARVIRRLGGDALAIYPIGGLTGELLRQLVAQENVASRTWKIANETREDFAVTETSSGQQYRFVLPGSRLNEADWQACLKLLNEMDPFPRFLVASGSLPPGVPDDFYARIAKIAKHRGAKMFLDAAGEPLAAALAEGLYLVKPNLRELAELIGRPLSYIAEWERAAKEIVANGQAAFVAVTLAHRGAALVGRDQVLRAAPIRITAVSAVGAGDSFLGAMIWRLATGHDLADAFRHATAAGAAALLNPGTELCRPDDVARFAKEAVISCG
jgi:6-phosphofructokinase 2